MKPIARYAMLKNGNDERGRDEYRMPESRFRDRTGREHYDNGRFAPMRSAYDGGTRMTVSPYPMYRGSPRYEMDDDFDIDDRRSWEIIENSAAYPDEYNDAGMRRIRGFSGSSEHRPGMEHGSGKVVPFFNKDIAERWMEGLQNDDGSRGPHWSLEDVKTLMKQRGINEDPVRVWAAMNAEYSDGVTVNRKYGVDRPEYYLDLACAKWLHDKDAVHDKLAAYYTYVAKH